jgi:hypothetical protein
MQSNTVGNRLTMYVNTKTEKLISPAALRLTEKILGQNSEELVEILHELAFELDLSHIAIVCFTTTRSWDVSLLTSVITYSKSWQTRYFFRRYGEIDPVIKWGSVAVLRLIGPISKSKNLTLNVSSPTLSVTGSDAGDCRFPLEVGRPHILWSRTQVTCRNKTGSALNPQTCNTFSNCLR